MIAQRDEENIIGNKIPYEVNVEKNTVLVE